MNLDVRTGPAAFTAFAPEWRALVGRSAANTPFQRVEFLQVSWEHFDDGELRVVGVRDEPGALLGLASLYVDREGVLRWVGYEEIADYQDVIAPTPQLQNVRRAVFDWWSGPEAPPWQRARLANIPDWTGTAEHWRSLAAAQGWSATVTQLDVCPVVPLPDTFEAYLAQLDSKQRREIRRKRRRAEGGGQVRWYIVGPEADIGAETEDFFALMAASHPDKAAFLTPPMRAAFRDLFQAFLAQGWLQLAFLEVDGRKVATYASYDVADRIWVYNSGLDASEAAALSPGWVLLAYLIEHAIETGHTAFDFLQGSEEYKYRFGGQDTQVWQLTIEKEP